MNVCCDTLLLQGVQFHDVSRFITDMQFLRLGGFLASTLEYLF